MKLIKKVKGYFHTCKSFKKCGLKQLSTWAGILIFVCVFNKDFVDLVNNVLTSDNLAQQVVVGLSGLIMVFFNRINKQ
jgi:hypothetical protein